MSHARCWSIWIAVVACAGVLPVGTALAEESPYAGMEHREIKALSPEMVASYLAGEGMGFAMAAELNSYPGPKHVLELKDQLSLTDTQIVKIRTAFDEMHRKAVQLGESLVASEQELDAFFARGDGDAGRLRTLVTKIARMRGELRLAHLDAHLEMRGVLSAEQIEAYDALRGYATGPDHSHEPGGPECDAHRREQS